MDDLAALIGTQIEERDGGKWVTGRCSVCATRVAIRAMPDGSYPLGKCEAGHAIRVVGERSKGANGPTEEDVRR